MSLVVTVTTLPFRTKQLGIIIVENIKNKTKLNNETDFNNIPTTRLKSIYKYNIEDVLERHVRDEESLLPGYGHPDFASNGYNSYKPFTTTIKLNAPKQTEIIQTLNYHQEVEPYNINDFQAEDLKNQEAAEVHYHRHSHYHKHNHHQGHSHIHQDQHRHQHVNTHDHYAHHQHQHQSHQQHLYQSHHNHNHKDSHSHKHNEEHKDDHDEWHHHVHKQNGEHTYVSHHLHKQDRHKGNKHNHQDNNQHQHYHGHYLNLHKYDGRELRRNDGSNLQRRKTRNKFKRNS